MNYLNTIFKRETWKVSKQSTIGIALRIGGFFALFSIYILVSSGFAQTIHSIVPHSQHVHGIITIKGSGFGELQSKNNVLFTNGKITVKGGKAYVWRDDFIQIRVPVGDMANVTSVAFPNGWLDVFIRTDKGKSNKIRFDVIIDAADNSLEFQQLTQILGHLDISAVLGTPNMNSARTKDAELGDVNGDGYMDILDNNSNNQSNDSHSVLRVNNQDNTFTAIPFEPLNESDTGTFAAMIPDGAEHFTNGVSYDADFADVNNDGLPDLIHTASMGDETNRVRLFLNDTANPGNFVDRTATWLADGVFLADQFPDDLDHADINKDGFVDFIVTLRKRNDQVDHSITKVFLNNNGSSFHVPLELHAPSGVSTHDAFFIDADGDGDEDIILCNETAGADAQLFLNNGSSTNPYPDPAVMTFDFTSEAGSAGDFNGDGALDFVLAGNGARVYLNNRSTPLTFTEVTLPTTGAGTFYDVELGDLNLDGQLDIIGAAITSNADNTVRIWLNNGLGTFSHWTSGGASARLPGLGDYQRLSADLLDYDWDGDLDLYLSGADGQDVGLGFGKVPNQFYENLKWSKIIYVDSASTDTERGTLNNPYRTIAQGRNRTSTNGSLMVKGGNYNENLTFTRKLVIHAIQGTVRIGK